jgi:ubiquinone/menaquinone biosynthesis C-methylase UbiE
MMVDLYKKVLDANVEVHTRLAKQYNVNEPHFRPENIERVSKRLSAVLHSKAGYRQLDLGCGTGFMINIGKQFSSSITGVDITKAMLDEVDTSGEALVKLVNQDTGSFVPEAQGFDFVTAYSFLHHLCDLAPTLKTAYTALRPGGVFYADLEPNWYFWQAISELNGDCFGSPLLEREISQVSFKDQDVNERFGIDPSTFNHAEYSKNISGGFREYDLRQLLLELGFSRVEVFYSWFLGQGAILNDARTERGKNAELCDRIESHLGSIMPVTRSLFKYLGFYAFK